jgi:hypothetical protein
MCTEVQGRMALHGHASIWAGIPPDIVQVMLQWNEGLVKIQKVMKSYIQCHIPPVYHLKRAAMYATPPAERKEKNLYETNKPIYHDLQEQLIYNTIYNVINTTANVHEHTETCEKAPHGVDGCRLAYRQEAVNDVDVKVIEIVSVTKSEIKTDDYVNIKDPNIAPISFQERNMEEQPLPISSKRCFVCMPPRPFIPLQQYHTDNLEDLIKQGDFTGVQIEQWLNIIKDLNDKDRAFVEHVLTTRNEAVVNFSPTATQCLCCNTAAYLLGGMEQAKAILFYLIKYITKDSTKVTLCLNIIRDARKKIKKYPSRAADTGTDKRTGQYLLTVMANKHTGLSEIADTQTALCLLDMPNQVGTGKTTYVFIKSAIADVQEKLAKIQNKTAFKSCWIDRTVDSNGLFDDPLIRLSKNPNVRDENDVDSVENSDSDNEEQFENDTENSSVMDVDAMNACNENDDGTDDNSQIDHDHVNEDKDIDRCGIKIADLMDENPKQIHSNQCKEKHKGNDLP